MGIDESTSDQLLLLDIKVFRHSLERAEQVAYKLTTRLAASHRWLQRLNGMHNAPRRLRSRYYVSSRVVFRVVLCRLAYQFGFVLLRRWR